MGTYHHTHTLPESPPLPSAWSTRQSFKNTRQRLYRVSHSAKRARHTVHRQSFLCRVLFLRHSAKKISRYGAGWRRQRLCRVLASQHSAKNPPERVPMSGTLPSAGDIILGKEPIPMSRSWFFAECYGPDTRQSTSLPSVTLGKVTSIHLFYLFFIFHPNKQKIPHTHHIYHIHTSQISSQT